jgi:replicative DNA helicase
VEVVHQGGELLERKILALLLQYPELLPDTRNRLSAEDFDNSDHRKILERLLAVGEKNVKQPSKLVNSLSDLGLDSLVSELCFIEEKGQAQQFLGDYIRKLEEKRLIKEKHKIEEQLRDAEKKKDQSQIDQLTRRLNEIAQKRYHSASSQQ